MECLSMVVVSRHSNTANPELYKALNLTIHVTFCQILLWGWSTGGSLRVFHQIEHLARQAG